MGSVFTSDIPVTPDIEAMRRAQKLYAESMAERAKAQARTDAESGTVLDGTCEDVTDIKRIA